MFVNMKREVTFIMIDGSIYKWDSSLLSWVRRTNIQDGVDRCYSFPGIDTSKLQINSDRARRLINEYWRGVREDWEFGGTRYNNHTPAGIESDRFGWERNLDLPKHRSQNELIDQDFYKVWYQGRLYWAILDHTPRVQLFKFRNGEDIDYSDFIRWAHIRDCRGIWNETEGKYE